MYCGQATHAQHVIAKCVIFTLGVDHFDCYVSSLSDNDNERRSHTWHYISLATRYIHWHTACICNNPLSCNIINLSGFKKPLFQSTSEQKMLKERRPLKIKEKARTANQNHGQKKNNNKTKPKKNYTLPKLKIWKLALLSVGVSYVKI